MRNAKNPCCLDLAEVPEDETSPSDAEMERKRGGGGVGEGKLSNCDRRGVNNDGGGGGGRLGRDTLCF